MRYLDELAINHIATGAAFLGTGGGGDPSINRLIAVEAVRTYGPIGLIEVEDVPDNEWILPAASIGAPTVGAEKLLSWAEVDESLRAANAALPRSAYATMPAEVGGGNALLPMILAARHSLPVVDADALGRAFPEIQMSTFALDGLPVRPFSLADEKGNSAVVTARNAQWMEALARPLVDTMGGSATCCIYPCTGAELKRSAIRGSVSLAQRIGRTLLDRSVHKGDPLGALVEALDAHVLLSGKVADLQSTTSGGFVRGTIYLSGLGEDKGRNITIHFQNEYLIALENGQPCAMTPDLICLLDRDTAMPITTENLRYGARVTLVALACDPKWRSAAGVEATGPRYFGYDFDYVPVGAIVGVEV